MTRDGIRVFLPALREVDRKLNLPLSRRIRILRELEFDLEELRRRLVGQGLPPVEAQARSHEALVPEGIALRELSELHAPLYQRLTRHLSERHLRLTERSALALATLALLVTEVPALMRADLLQSPSPFLWPVLGSGVLLFAAILAKAFQLWIKGDHRALDRGLSGILGLAGAAFGVGVGGMMIDLYRLAAILETTPELAETLGTAWMLRDSALLSIATLVALSGCLAWFLMAQWTALVSSDRRDVLGLAGFPDVNHLQPTGELRS